MQSANAIRALLRHRWSKPIVWVACASPLVWLIWGAAHDLLGANPAEYITRSSGEQALRMLCLTLSVTPLRVQARWPELARFRRLLGLWTYAYAFIHASCYAWLDMGFDLSEMAHDVLKRPFIWVGVTSFALLTPLAATSWAGAVRWLGAARWQRLHRLVYGVAPLVLLHYFWMRSGKNHFDAVWFYGLWLAVVLAWRVRAARS